MTPRMLFAANRDLEQEQSIPGLGSDFAIPASLQHMPEDLITLCSLLHGLSDLPHVSMDDFRAYKEYAGFSWSANYTGDDVSLKNFYYLECILPEIAMFRLVSLITLLGVMPIAGAATETARYQANFIETDFKGRSPAASDAVDVCDCEDLVEDCGCADIAPLASFCQSSQGWPQWWVRAHGGTDAFSVPGDSEFGALYGVDVAGHLLGSWSLIGTVHADQVSEGTLLSGSFGFLRVPRFCYDDWMQRVSMAVLFDQFYDSRYDNGIYLNQLRVQFGYAVNDCFEIGGSITENLNEDRVGALILPFDFVDLMDLRLTPSLGAYVAGRRGPLNWSAQVGYRRAIQDVTFGAGARLRLTPKLAAITTAEYGPKDGLWSGMIGLQVAFGPNGRASGCCPSSVSDCADSFAEASPIRQASYQDQQDPPPLQLPTFAFQSVSTTVSVPDGGTVLLGGIKRLQEGRPGYLGSSISGVPVNPALRNVPYVARLFKNVGIGRQSNSLMLMVTPRIIIQEEEE